MSSADEVKVLEVHINVLTRRFDEFLSSCIGEDKKPRAPSASDIARARGYLPPGYKNSFPTKEKK